MLITPFRFLGQWNPSFNASSDRTFPAMEHFRAQCSLENSASALRMLWNCSWCKFPHSAIASETFSAAWTELVQSRRENSKIGYILQTRFNILKWAHHSMSGSLSTHGLYGWFYQKGNISLIKIGSMQRSRIKWLNSWFDVTTNFTN